MLSENNFFNGKLILSIPFWYCCSSVSGSIASEDTTDYVDGKYLGKYLQSFREQNLSLLYTATVCIVFTLY